MTNINIDLEKELYDEVNKRAKKNYQTIKELCQDIIRRSMITYKRSGGSKVVDKTDDSLISVFSRLKRGRKRK